ncbi:ABC transporter permease [Embleya sp. AB8]|uniref:ABC transporter permease n=1 Tax=Embleya sp. AB8 TaxID=3156304 RepID=UPI003C7758C0
MTTTPAPPTTPASPAADERVTPARLFHRLLVRPELGSLIGALLVLGFFSFVADGFFTAAGAATWLDDSATLGIMAVAVALLMIGGEFDLSAGVMTASTALITAMLSTRAGWSVWPALTVSLLFALAVGALNGWLVVRTGLPSFIITLGTFLALQGLNLGVTRQVTDSVQVSGMRATEDYAAAARYFASTLHVAGTEIQISVSWWLILAALGTWVLARTRFGNWIYAVGGAPVSARNVGVPVDRTKIMLFMTTAGAAWLVGSINILRYTSVQANQGIGLEFQYIIAAVIGGCLLTGGYGSAIGAAVGALIFGMARQGIVYAKWNSDWFQLFLGVLLLAAVLVNNSFRRRAERSRR